MSYNRINYNTTLYNGSPEDFSATAKSIIQAHTGPHIQSVIGGNGLSFISDFIISQGSTEVPSSFFFPDLAASIRTVHSQKKNLGAYIRGFGFLDLPAAIYPVDRVPDLAARINFLITTDLGAFILGKLAELNLGASIQGTEFSDILGSILGIDAPNLGAFIGAHLPADLGAIIWAPEDLTALISPVFFGDLVGSIQGFSFKDLAGNMLGVPAPNLIAVLKSFQDSMSDLPSALGAVPGPPDLGAVIGILGPFLPAILNPVGGYLDLPAVLYPSINETLDLAAQILGTQNLDLSAFLNILDQQLLSAILIPITFDRIRDIPAYIQPVNTLDLAATITALLGISNLSATIASSTTVSDLAARLVVDETFITSILTIITMSATNLGAVIGNPDCDGGSAIKELSALANTQYAWDLGASIQSFTEAGLGAVINFAGNFFAFDTIDITYTGYNPRPTIFRFTDSIDLFYTPFRGATLSASIAAVPPDANLSALLTASFPLPKVSPFKNRITAIDLKSNPLDITDIRLQLEGEIVDFFYVQGLDSAFIKDPNDQWRINIRSFKDIAANVFGDHEVDRICRLGQLESFATLDEAIRFCITSVLGLSSQNSMGAYINATGSFTNLRSSLSVVNTFSDLLSSCGRVFPSDLLSAIINPGGPTDLSSFIVPIGQQTVQMGGSIEVFAPDDLGATITGLL